MLETIIYMFHEGESGILFCPWTPIYGVGTVIIIFCYQFIKKIDKKWLRILLIFLTGFILLSLLELMGGIIIEKLFNVVFWSYKGFKFNIGNYIALEISLLWGLASLLVIWLLRYTDKIVKKIPRLISWLLIILMICDIVLTILSK